MIIKLAKSRRILRSAFVCGVGIALAAAAHVPSHGSSGNNNAPGGEAPLVDTTVSELTDTLEPLRAESGFTSFAVDNVQRTLTVYWKGTESEALQRARKTAVEAGVALEVREAKYSDAELDAAAVAVLRAAKEHGVPVQAVGMNTDGSGLEIEVLAQSGREKTLDSAEDELSGLLTVDVTFKAVEGEPVPRARNNMNNPFKGGGVLTFSNGNGCTAGFSVVDSSGRGYLLSAGHCAPQGNPNWVRTGDGSAISNAQGVRVHNYLDSLLIDPTPSPATDGRVFHGGMNTNNKIGVGGWTSASEGEEVCVSGAFTAATGANCNAEVYWVGRFRCGVNYDSCKGFRARTTDGHVIGGAGDSGSPVYIRRGSDGRAGARGIYVQGVSGFQSYCDKWRGGSNYSSRCDSRIAVVDIMAILNDWNVSMETHS